MKFSKSVKNVIILFLLIIFFASLRVGAFAETFYVEIDGSDSNGGSSSDSDDAFKTIQGAIDNDDVEDDDTIYVGEGTFSESLVISKSVTIYGDGTNNTIIKADNSDDNIITVSADDVSIKYLTVTGADATDAAGIYVESGVEDFSLYYSEVTDNYIGCYLNETDDASISGNDFTENEIGLYLNSANDTSVTSNEFEENTQGLFIYNSEIEDISGNTFEENDYGIYLDDSDGYFSSDDSTTLESDNTFDDNVEEDVYLDDDGDTISCFISSTNSSYLTKVWQYMKARFK